MIEPNWDAMPAWTDSAICGAVILTVIIIVGAAAIALAFRSLGRAMIRAESRDYEHRRANNITDPGEQWVRPGPRPADRDRGR